MNRLQAMKKVLQCNVDLFYLRGTTKVNRIDTEYYVKKWSEDFAHAINYQNGIIQKKDNDIIAIEDYMNGYTGILLSTCKCTIRLGKVIFEVD